MGLLIANVVSRPPTLLAKQAVTLDHVSGGRFDLGIGRLLTGDTADHAGPYYPYRDAAMAPPPVAGRIPVIVAAKSCSSIGFTDIVVYAPKPHERAMFDKVVNRLGDLRS